MRTRVKYIKYPQAIIYQTPQQAYLIVSGPSVLYQARQKREKKAGISVQCSHRPQRQQNQPKQCLCNKLKNQDCKKRRKSQYLQRRTVNASKCQSPKKAGVHPSTFSFRDLNLPHQSTIYCNYNQLIYEQNACLKKENKFLQDYIQTLQLKRKKSVWKVEKHNKIGSSRYESTRNSFMNKNMESSNKESEDERSTLGKRMLSSKEEGWHTQYRN